MILGFTLRFTPSIAAKLSQQHLSILLIFFRLLFSSLFLILCFTTFVAVFHPLLNLINRDNDCKFQLFELNRITFAAFFLQFHLVCCICVVTCLF